MKICVLGAGLIGAPMAIDLSKDNNFEVSSIDINENNLNKLSSYSNIYRIKTDITKDLENKLEGFDLVINALPSALGYATLKKIIEAGKNVVDITFFEEDPLTLDELAKSKGVTAIVDCGIAPGMSNILTGHLVNTLDETSKVRIYVGGVPAKKEQPWEYKAVFAPEDVINEYLRPCRYIENGEIVTKPALSEPEMISFDKVGDLEAFNTDGLRSLLFTINVPDMREKTLRYSGHIDKIMTLRESGFFSSDPIEVNGVMVKPIDFTSKILFPQWAMNVEDRDITVFRVEAEGIKDGKNVKCTYDLIDEYDEETRIHSMARTTGYTATVAARMLLGKVFDKKGITVPEYIGKEKTCVEYMLNGLNERGVDFKMKITEL